MGSPQLKHATVFVGVSCVVVLLCLILEAFLVELKHFLYHPGLGL